MGDFSPTGLKPVCAVPRGIDAHDRKVTVKLNLKA